MEQQSALGNREGRRDVWIKSIGDELIEDRDIDHDAGSVLAALVLAHFASQALSKGAPTLD